MIEFKKKDVVIHPNYGVGVILAITPINDRLSALEVNFAEAGVCKEFNSQWVEKNCKYEPFVPQEKLPKAPKPEFKDGIYYVCPELSSDSWKVSIEENCKVTEEFKEDLAYVMHNVTPGINLVLIGKAVVVTLLPEEGETDEEIEKAARKYMTKVFRNHPDFGCMDLQDGGLLVSMLDDRLWFFINPSHVRRKENGDVTFESLFLGRAVLMDRCRQKEMFAILRGI